MRPRFILIGAAGALAVAFGAGAWILSNLDIEDYRQDIAELVSRETGRRVLMQGPMDLDILWPPSLTIRDAGFGNAEWGSEPDMARIGELAIEFAFWPLFAGSFEVRGVALRDGDLLLETDGSGRGNWQVGEEGPPPRPPEVKRVRLENMRLTWRGGEAGRDIVFQAEQVDAMFGDDDTIRLEAEGQVAGQRAIVKATTGGLRLLQGQRPFPVDGELALGDTRLSLQGAVAEPARIGGIDLAVRAEGSDLAPLAALAGFNAPSGRPFVLRGQLSGDVRDRLSATGLDFGFGRSRLAGEVSLAMGGERPKLRAKLSSPLFDVADFTIAGDGPSPLLDALTGGEGRIFSDAPLPLDGLGLLDLDLELSAAKLLVGNGELEEVSLSLTLDDRDLEIAPSQARYGSSRLAGSASFSGAGETPALSLDVSAGSLDVGRLLHDYGGIDILVGQVDVDVSGKGAGRSVRALMASFDGSLEMVMGEGELRTRATEILAADLLDEIAPWAPDNDRTRIECFVAGFEIRNGAAEVSRLLLETGRVTIQGEGSVDLGQERLALTLKPRPKDVSLISLAVPIDVDGTILNPELAPDAVSVAANVATAIAGAAINPLGVLLPFLSTGAGDENRCVAAFEESGERRQRRNDGPGADGGGGQRGAAPVPAGGILGTLEGWGRAIDRAVGQGPK